MRSKNRDEILLKYEKIISKIEWVELELKLTLKGKTPPILLIVICSVFALLIIILIGFTLYRKKYTKEPEDVDKDLEFSDINKADNE